MSRIAILGLGLMGASLGLALKKVGGRVVSGYARRQETRDEALEREVVDEVFEHPADAVRGANLVVLCGPVQVLPELAAASREGLAPGTLVTDVGSTKATLADQVPAALEGSGAIFIGSHPVAGSEKRGLESAIPSLYDGALVVVTPREKDGESEVQTICEFWQLLGSRVHRMSPEAHDDVLARTSHLPHLVATLLALAVGRNHLADDTGSFCGTGFRDTSRLASGSPDLWRDIVDTNRDSIVSELTSYRDCLEELLHACRADELEKVEEILKEGVSLRQALLDGRERFMNKESS